MVDKDEIKAFGRFLDEASDGELRERLRVFDEALRIFPRGETRKDFEFLQRKVQQEIIARLEVKLVTMMNDRRRQAAS
jgi:hypothetical protein